MSSNQRIIFIKYVWLFGLLLWGDIVFSQTAPTNTATNPNSKKDTSKTNTNKWKDEDAKITWQKLDSRRVYNADSGIHAFQRNPFSQPWYRDIGNLGSPANNLLFTPENRVGPSLGYHVFDIYRFNPDSLNFYNTSRPYSVFNYLLGSKLEQTAGISHTQNVKPNWNIDFEYRKINSPGFYKIERTNHDNACITSTYHSLDKHYSMMAAMVYNKEQNDENGGIIDPTELNNAAYSDRRTIDAAFQSQYSLTRSSVTNVQRDFTFLLQHRYTWGNTDTTYNEDSTQYSFHLRPLFSITHKMEISTEKHTYTDLTPDSLRYVSLFQRAFSNNGTGYYTPGSDSVITCQKWFWIDNKVMLNGFLGKGDDPMTFSAGIGNRYDQFISQPVSNLIHDSLPDSVYSQGRDMSQFISTYLSGEIKKEALHPGEWEYGANTQFFVTGQEAGSFSLNAMIGRELKKIPGSFVAGFGQRLNSAPYSFTNYENPDIRLNYTFNKESVTSAYGKLDLPGLRLSGGVTDYVIGNYIYISELEKPAQYTVPFTLLQGWVRKVFKLGYFFLDNELVYQQLPVNAPVNVPVLMGRHQLTYERAMFKKMLKIVAGVEIRYNCTYYPSGYDPILNKFFYQHSTEIGNVPEASVFLNFRVKRFRAFVMADNLQQLIAGNTLLYTGIPVINFNNTGSNFYPVYAAPDALIRFGFSWPLVN